jgi:hypothetical protein
MIDYLPFYVPLKNILLVWRLHHCRWRTAKFWLMLGAQGLWAGRDLYLATSTVTRGFGFSGLIQRTAPISRLLRHTWGWSTVSDNTFSITSEICRQEEMSNWFNTEKITVLFERYGTLLAWYGSFLAQNNTVRFWGVVTRFRVCKFLMDTTST